MHATPDVYQSTTVADLQRLVGRIAERAPELAGRAEAAGALLLAGRVRPTGPTTFAVAGGAEQPYAVDLAADCDCPDYQRRGVVHQGRRYCKHMLAALLLGHLAKRARKRVAARHTRLRTYRQCATPRARRAASAA